MTATRKTVAIIGGGITGLSAAYFLQKQITKGNKPIDLILIEKENRLGGSIITLEKNGYIIEGGPDCFLAEKPETIRLCQQLGIEDQLMATNKEVKKIFILLNGKLRELPDGFMLLAPTSFSSFIKNPLITPLGKLRMAMDLILPAKKSAEEESLAQFVTRRLGKEVLEKIVEPLVAGIHAAEPEMMSAKSTFPRLLDIEKNYRSLIIGLSKRKKFFAPQEPTSFATMFMTLRKGLSTLINTLASSLPSEIIRTGNQVIEVKKNSCSYHINLLLEKGESLTTDAVLLATPAFVSAKLIKPIAPQLASELSSINYTSTATISVGYPKKDFPYSLNGFGFVVPQVENRKIMACTWSSVKFAHRAPKDSVLIRCFVGGVKNEELVYLKENDLIAIASQELRELMKITAEPLLTEVFRWPKAMPQYNVGHEEKIKRIENLLLSYPGIFLAGSAYQGIGISDCIRSGEKAAQAVLKFLS
ncbi:MAG: protoporphyrinogen oxidase [Desulfobacterota bacterium]|nr:protoporphyrinogen oxidase [Thermodesulfobacteriota bacterium]